MEKRGQLTVFIIIVLVLLLSTLLFFRYLNIREKPATEELPLAVIEEQVNTCLTTAAKEAVYLVGLQGGYVNPSGETTYWEGGDGRQTNEHYFLGQNQLPFVDKNLRQIEDIESVLANYAIIEVGKCLNFTAFEQQGIKVQKPTIDLQEIKFDYNKAIVDYSGKTLDSTTQIGDEVVLFNLKYPIKLEKGTATGTIEDFSTKVPLRFGFLYKKAAQLMQNIAREQPYDINQHCAEYASTDKMVNIYIDSNQYDYSYAIRIIDASPSTRQEMPLKFQFAMRNVQLTGGCAG